MLKRKTVTDTETRIKYACLALLASVLMPTTHHPKIVKEHAEKISDLATFFQYPWGRLGFEMLISSIKEKNEVILSQNTVAVKGFVHALQLVMVEAVPALLDVVQVNSNSSSESEGEHDKEDPVERKISLSPAHARDLHEAEKTVVNCIIYGDGNIELDETELGWSDGEEDEKVDNLVTFIREEHCFGSSMFHGGLTKVHVLRMVREAKERKTKKEKKAARNVESGGQSNGVCSVVPMSSSYLQHIADLVSEKIVGDINKLDDRVTAGISRLEGMVHGSSSKYEELKCAVGVMETDITLEMTQQILRMKYAVIDSILGHMDKSHPYYPRNHTKVSVNNVNNGGNITSPVDAVCRNLHGSQVRLDFSGEEVKNIIGGVLGDLRNAPIDFGRGAGGEGMANVGNVSELNHDVPCPSFSLGLTQEANHLPANSVFVEVEHGGENGDGGNNCRKSKRIKVLPASLLQDFQCDKRMLVRIREAHLGGLVDSNGEDYGLKYGQLVEKLKGTTNLRLGGVSVNTKDFLDIVGRSRYMQPKVVDVLIQYTRCLFNKPGFQLPKKCEFFDRKFVANLVKNFAKFKKMVNKDEHVFSKPVLQLFAGENAKNIEAERFYFPFNFDKTHWVAVCVDCTCATIYILDCDVALRSDVVIANELDAIAQLAPYLLKAVGRAVCPRDVRKFAVERPKCVPQNGNHLESGVTCVLLMQAHAIGGIEVCRCVSVECPVSEAERISVMMYVDNYGRF